ncbi:MAG: hypothetical protein QNJ90_08825 [Planctomycetota bacterium]|nr:hypothetical protein [Planctomycetota bacterium]
MNLRPVHLLIPLLGIALGLLVPFEKPKLPIKKKKGGAVAAPAVGGKWSNERYLSKRMEEACVWVKEATGMDFVEKPTVRRSTADAIAAFMAPDYDAAFRTLGAADEAGVRQMAAKLAARSVAAYDPAENVVHVVPENALAAAAAAGDDSLTHENVLRLLLVRMGVIAVDRQLMTGWKEALDAAKTPDAVACAGAVLQGHAQYETERIGKTWANQEQDFDADTFDKLVALITAPAAEDATPEGQAMASEGKFAIIKGHAFMQAIAKRRRPGIKGVFNKPPTDRGHILNPQSYLALFTKAGRMPEEILKEFAGLMPEAEGWTVNGEACPPADVEAWMAPLEKRIWNAEVSSFRKGNKWTATKGEPGTGTTVYLLEFRTGGMAESYVNLAKSAAEKSGAKIDEGGSGRDGGLFGFAGTREADGATNALQMTAEGKFVLAFVTTVDVDNREPWDDALEAAAEILAKAQKTRKNRKDK